MPRKPGTENRERATIGRRKDKQSSRYSAAAGGSSWRCPRRGAQGDIQSISDARDRLIPCEIGCRIFEQAETLIQQTLYHHDMYHLGPLNSIPIACTLSAETGRAQVDRWHRFDDRYALSRTITGDRLVVHYACSDESTAELSELVTTEKSCCAFVTWSVETDNNDLRLVVTGTPEQIEALTLTH